VVVVGDPDLGRLARGPAVVGIVLGESARGRGGLPDGFVEAAVEDDGFRGADGPDRLDGGSRGLGGGTRRGGAMVAIFLIGVSCRAMAPVSDIDASKALRPCVLE
jgi:hypothetical protein